MPSDDREFLSPGFRTEDVEQYAEGGFHPIRVGSKFRERYLMKGKIGYGGCGTVWWARDSVEQRDVALKILTAHASRKFDKLRTFYYHRPGEDRVPNHPGRSHIAKLIRTFWHRGPNGIHLCLVLELAGPKIEDYLKSRPTGGLKLSQIQKMAHESATAMAYLHSNRFVHGDFTINNIFLTITPPHKWASHHLLHLERLHATVTSAPLERLHGEPAPPQGPRIITSCTHLHRLPPEILTSSITVGDLDASFPADDPPEDVFLLPPLNYCAPELLGQGKPRAPDIQTDVWSLGCTIFAMRAGRALFKRPRSRNVDIMLLQMQGVLGDSPAIQALSQERPELEDDDARLRDLAHSLITQNSKPLRQLISEIGQDHDDKDREEALMTTIPEGEDFSAPSNEVKAGKGWMCIPTTPAEVDSLCDLLSKMLQYELENRIDVDEVVRHPWFTTNFGIGEV